MLFAVGEFLESSLETPELQVVFCGRDRLEHAHRLDAIFQLLVDVLGDVHSGGDEPFGILQILRETFEVPQELLDEFGGDR